MKAIEFNHENAIKAATEFAKGLARDSARNVIRSKTEGEEIDRELYGMAKAASTLVGILTDFGEFHEVINFLAEKGITIE